MKHLLVAILLTLLPGTLAWGAKEQDFVALMMERISSKPADYPTTDYENITVSPTMISYMLDMMDNDSDNSKYYDENTRAYQEQYGPVSARPAINATLGSTDYDVVLLGFPIWYGKVPRVVLTFLDTYDFSGKTVIPFCTSGSSGISAAQTELQSTYPVLKWKTGARLNGYTDEQLQTWLAGLGIRNTSFTLTIGGINFTAELANNATAQAFNALLPMTLNMTELNGNEKYKYLDTTLPTHAACPGTIRNGDILLYGNNCVVVFYKTFDTSYNYTKIGRITDPSGLAAAVGGGSIEIQFGY